MGLELRNLVVVITGASKGIGAATALEFASKGCRVALAARSEGLLKDVAEKVETRGVMPSPSRPTCQRLKISRTSVG